ncbi:cora-domain-containing protein [Patellaria atrata CBS 101060]|uniref:Cora-domain-containing protein n=1 Tax=Patellaria atrata CBS 101060 TaxID=1346257 RepID=A0A9P4S2T7_9PEZI|nr:cora-domain-containing protein [Patellaria atrata CBS 101060]
MHANGPSTSPDANGTQSSQTVPTTRKKKRHRAGKKRRNRRQSFAALSDTTENPEIIVERPTMESTPSGSRENFYRLGRVLSSTSLESEALLDHRDHGPLQARRQSLQQGAIFAPRPSQPYTRTRTSLAPSHQASHQGSSPNRPRPSAIPQSSDDEDTDDHTPLISSSHRERSPPAKGLSSSTYGALGGFFGSQPSERRGARSRQRSASSSEFPDFDVNNPPSRPASPGYDDVMLTGDLATGARSVDRLGDAVIDIDHMPEGHDIDMKTPSERRLRDGRAEDDVCWVPQGDSILDEEEYKRTHGAHPKVRRRRKLWPDVSVLEDWAAVEKEQRTIQSIRARKVSEPVLVAGRLRPQKKAWHREEEDAPYRFTYFSDELEDTIHSSTISELPSEDMTFKDLFIPEPPLLSDSDSDSEDDNGRDASSVRSSRAITAERQSSSGEQTGRNTPVPITEAPAPKQKQKRYGPVPTWWLDVLSPTDAEMRVLSKAFNIHPLTAEDIMQQEAREKVELFRDYYLVSYRTFEQDPKHENYMDPVNMYLVVFKDGIISFHFSMVPHPANVRRRVRQLKEFLVLSADWISYGIIDDITDAYVPLIQDIENEVDNIDDEILNLHRIDAPDDCDQKYKEDEKASISGDKLSPNASGDMLLRVGECRKRVMSLYRLLGNKADVIKGFAKRCNEQWEVAPRSDIGLYLGDIQDHIVTMTGNLSHYESLLSRAHSNYLAQINILMNERQEKTADVLGKLTVLGTIVLPMNIVTGMWGMNVMVPGQTVESLTWFWSITAGLVLFGLTSFFVAKRVYGIV